VSLWDTVIPFVTYLHIGDSRNGNLYQVYSHQHVTGNRKQPMLLDRQTHNTKNNRYRL